MPVSKSFNHLSASVSMKEVEEKAPMKQGIVTILGSDCERSRAASIRRTLSADMSSKKWLAQNGFFSQVKKISSSEELVVNTDGDSSSSFSYEECEKNPGQDDVWRSIQSQKQMQNPAKLDVWGTILTQKSENPAASDLLPPPYVHPLVRRSASSLSEKSLEICTESLGSETGSDGFSSYPSSEILSDGDDDKEERLMVALEDDIKLANPFEDLHVVKYKSCPVRPFPPPLPSISGGDGASLHIHSHRKNGRLVLEAIAVPPRKYFRAQRANGRLILTLINRLDSQEKKAEEFEEVFDNMEEVDTCIEEEKVEGGSEDDNEEEEEVLEVEKEKFNVNNGAKEVEIFMEQNSKSLPSTGMIKSLPPRPPARLIPSPTVTAAFNSYEYFWWSKNAMTGGQTNPMITTQQPTLHKYNEFNGGKAYNHQEMAPTSLKGNKTEHFVPYLRGCNEKPRSSSPLIWQPCCTATS